jgi:hypothetical protein
MAFFLEIMGYVLQLIAIIVGGQLFLQFLMNWNLLTGMFKLMPASIRVFNPKEPLPVWLERWKETEAIYQPLPVLFNFFSCIGYLGIIGFFGI